MKYISDYVLNREIKKSTPERKLIDKQINKQKIKVLDYNRLITNQREIYNHSYII